MARKARVTVRRWLAALWLAGVACGAGAQGEHALDEVPEASAGQAAALRGRLEVPPSSDGTPADLAKAYLERAQVARRLQMADRERLEVEAGIAALGAENAEARPLFSRLARCEADRGDHAAALRARQQALRLSTTPGQTYDQQLLIANLYASLRRRTEARAMLDQAEQTLARLRKGPNWTSKGTLWQGRYAHALSFYYQTGGQLHQAEPLLRECVAQIGRHLRGNDTESGDRFYLVSCSDHLAGNLLAQGRLREAEVAAAEAAAEATTVATAQDRPLIRARFAGTQVRVLMEQGRYDEARALIERAIADLKEAQAPEHSALLSGFRWQLAVLAMMRGDWREAHRLHSAREAGLKGGSHDSRRLGTASPEWVYTLLRLGEKQRALEMASRIVATREGLFDERALGLWEGRAFRGLALAANGRSDEALQVLAEAVPQVVALGGGERSSADSGVVRAARLGWILDGYIRLLGEAARSGPGPVAGLDPVDESFRIADLARASVVQRALLAATARLEPGSAELRTLVRREQDLQREVSALSDTLSSLLLRTGVAPGDRWVAEMRTELDRLRREQGAVQQRLREGFPDYAGLLEPQPVGLAETARVLRPGEALVAFFVASDRTLVWAVPAQGKPAFAVAPMTPTRLAEEVDRLRKALDPGTGDLDHIPPFDLEAAHRLYRDLLLPVEAGWRGAQELIVVPHGALGRLPLAVLTTRPFLPEGKGLRFDELAAAPWLIRDVAVSQVPSVTVLPALRRRGKSVASLPFLAFGDPQFRAGGETPAAPSPGLKRHARALPTTASRAVPPVSRAFELLSPLPDTAAEVREIAGVLAADSRRDLYLGRRATESAVKAAELERYRVLMFATHGLLPGELRGLFQPALVLANPALAGEREDGLLTLEEILGLKLNADWVVLSACNTASPDGRGEEAVSGLGRAFFYAGTRALLVSNWPVESESARLLTTEMFRRQQQDRGVSRAQALRDAELALMQRQATDEHGRPVCSYAHPMFWAPFSLVGDGSSAP